jgi:hypothetical protein
MLGIAQVRTGQLRALLSYLVVRLIQSMIPDALASVYDGARPGLS